MKLTERQITILSEIVDKALDMVLTESKNQEEYQKFFKSMLKKFGVSSPTELKGDKKKKFFAAVKAGWAKKKK